MVHHSFKTVGDLAFFQADNASEPSAVLPQCALLSAEVLWIHILLCQSQPV